MPAAPAAPAVDPIASAIENTKALITAKKSIQSDLQAARDFLNQSIRMKITTDEQTAWIQENLPKHTRAPKGDAEIAA